ncbi:hypothetical protein AOL_s00007g237 [Orbilia oligospora ATCC 24927]|uniref:BTB domain-containing protein n=2 Tax=Orbilia oligospora TaxID=2813651 RepID=G1X1S8_ARTOA|nr:hypothetical protein AOL_s00007g237 [Orbilia oligospora ATCC 24927]EGX52901.1 hypothetical protein AOL_s00007g237 [Orbilia oligospora ATCC 24927]KAF3287705.1 hypothetical protein TWF970_007414 [Orbilia oligospora]
MYSLRHHRVHSHDVTSCNIDQDRVTSFLFETIDEKLRVGSKSAPVIMNRDPKTMDQLRSFPNPFQENPTTYGMSAEHKARRERIPPWFRTPRQIFELGGERDSLSETAYGQDLKDYLLYQGIHMGIGSDVTLVITDVKTFKLHRFMLSQAPMFREAFEQLGEDADPFHWDAIDDIVDIAAVEHIINRMYGNMGDKHYEAKNLVPLMGICIQWGLGNWFHAYLDRFMSRLSAENLTQIVDFAMDEFYGEWVEPHVLPIVKHYMTRYGSHLGLKVWRALPVDWVVQILTYDGFILTDTRACDAKRELGYCQVVMGHEYERWVFARNIYYDRLGLDDEVLHQLEQNRVFPEHITAELIEEQYPLYELLNGQRIQYCNMSPFNWQQVRKEKLLAADELVRPDVLATSIFNAVRLRRCIQDANLDRSKLNLTFPYSPELLEEGQNFEVPNIDRYIYRPRRVELQKDPVKFPKIGEDGIPVTGDVDFPQLTSIPPIRFSVEFQFHRGIGAMNTSSPLCAEPVFYAGSWWQFSIRKINDETESAERINMYLRRVGKPARPPRSAVSDETSATFPEVNYEALTRQHLEGLYDGKLLDKLLEGEASSMEFYDDKRQNVTAYFRVFAPSLIAGYDPEKFIIISGSDFPKIRAPAITRTTIFEGKPIVFPLDTDIVIPGRLLVHEVEEAEELKDFSNDSPYFEGECNKILEGGAIELPKKRESYQATIYHHTGEVFGEWEKEGKGGPDRKVTMALKERDIAWSNLKFGIVIGIV